MVRLGVNSVMAKGDRLKKAEEQWRQLVDALDKELPVFKRNRDQTGRILYEIKVFLAKHGWDKGRRGRWKPLLAEKQLSVSTANDLVRDYEEMANLPASERFFAPPTTKNSQKHRKKNSAVSALLSGGLLDLTGKPFPDGKEIVEAVFVLTADEKHQFMKSVRILTPVESLHLMFETVVRHAGLREGKTETVTLPIATPTPHKRLTFLADEEETV
jgi:hypothetical protein